MLYPLSYGGGTGAKRGRNLQRPEPPRGGEAKRRPSSLVPVSGKRVDAVAGGIWEAA